MTLERVMLATSSLFLGLRFRLVAVVLASVALGLAPQARAQQGSGDVETIHVQGNVHMIVGSGANIAVQVGEDGVLVVDTGL